MFKTGVEILKIPFTVASQSVNQVNKTMTDYARDYIQAHVTFYIDAVRD